MKLLHVFVVVITAGGLGLGAPARACAQEPVGQGAEPQLAQQQGGNVPAPVQGAVESAARTAKHFRMGIEGGVGLDPELIMFGGHGSFGPILSPNVTFRPGIEFGIGELTTLFGVNLDVTYTFHQDEPKAWSPYIGTGPNFSLSHQSFETTDTENVSTDGGSNTTSSTVTTSNGTTTTTSTKKETPNRFDFGDTNFDAGWNFIAGARKGKMFFEMKATAYGVSNVRLLVGLDF